VNNKARRHTFGSLNVGASFALLVLYLLLARTGLSARQGKERLGNPEFCNICL
jgi:hypothetical protein